MNPAKKEHDPSEDFVQINVVVYGEETAGTPGPGLGDGVPQHHGQDKNAVHQENTTYWDYAIEHTVKMLIGSFTQISLLLPHSVLI